MWREENGSELKKPDAAETTESDQTRSDASEETGSSGSDWKLWEGDRKVSATENGRKRRKGSKSLQKRPAATECDWKVTGCDRM